MVRLTPYQFFEKSQFVVHSWRPSKIFLSDVVYMNKVLIGIIAVITILLLIRWFWYRKNKLTDLANATEEQEIDSADLANSSQSTNFAYSVWFYVNDWSYQYGEKKTILVRNEGEACPHIFLDPMENNLEVVIFDYNDTYNRCRIENVPLQKWVNLIVSVYNQTLDLYLDGKLIKTCVLDGVPKLDASEDVYVTPDGGFSGWTSNIEYWDKALNPQEAHSVYQKGNGTSGLGGIFKYGIKVQFTDDDEVKGSIQI